MGTGDLGLMAVTFVVILILGAFCLGFAFGFGEGICAVGRSLRTPKGRA